MTAPIGIGWYDPEDAGGAALEGGYGPLVIGEGVTSLRSPGGSLAAVFDDRMVEVYLDADAMPARIHAARNDGTVDIFTPGPSLWQRIAAWWRSLTGPVPGDSGATISSAYGPWGWM